MIIRLSHPQNCLLYIISTIGIFTCFSRLRTLYIGKYAFVPYNKTMKKKGDLTARIDVRLSQKDKNKLIKLAKAKGTDSITGLLRLMARAKKVEIGL